MRRLQIGEKIGDYSILAFLGAGGMGEVYQGLHTKINRPAAIKVLSNYDNNSTFITRFFNEARLQSSLQHPNIATLYDFQEINNQLYIFMEYADGESLEDLIRRRAFTVEDALKTFEAVCEAIAFMHRNGVIHRDIKAQNIKLTSTGTVKVLDFGIAKDSASQRLTKIGGIIGTPNYLAPEQLAGKEASHRTDIWALGVLFYEMLTGSEPFKAATFGELHSKISIGSFEPPENINPAVGREVSQIASKCLEKNPEERYRAAEEILADVRRILRGEKPRPLFSLRRFSVFSPKGVSENSAENGLLNSRADYDRLRKNPKPVAASNKSPFLFVAAASATAVLLLFSVVGIGIWAMSADNPNAAPTGNSSTLKPPGFSKNTKAAIVRSAPNSNLSRVRIEINEGSAQVFRDGQFVGTTPFELAGKEGEVVNITLKREGFEDKSEQIDIIARRPIYTFSFKPKK